MANQGHRHMIGTLFLRSFHRGERVYLAMLSRGYHGTMPESMAGRFGWDEFLFLSLSPLLFFLRIYLDERIRSIEISHLSYHYPDGTPALRDIDWRSIDMNPLRSLAQMAPGNRLSSII